jgi:HK97 family phage prohead protease
MDVLPFTAELLLDNTTLEKHSVPAGNWIVEGYASTSDLDSQNHIVTPEAIKMGAESLKKYNTVLFNHDPDRPIGQVMHSEAQDTKLLVKVAISKTEPKIWEQIKDGTLSKFSIRGSVTDSEYYTDERSLKEIRKITAMELHEISVVAVPANPEARSIAYYIEKALIASTISTLSKDNLRKKIKEVLEEDVQKDQKSFESAIKNLESGLGELQGEDKDQVETIIRSLTALVGRVYQKSMDNNKGGQVVDKKDEKEEVIEKAEEKKDDKVIEKADEKVQKVEVDVSALTAVMSQLQDMVKSVTEKSEKVESEKAEIAKAKDEVEKSKTELVKTIADFTALVKEIPIRRGAAPEKEEEKPVVEVKKDITKSDEYQKAKPGEQFKMLAEQYLN